MVEQTNNVPHESQNPPKGEESADTLGVPMPPLGPRLSLRDRLRLADSHSIDNGGQLPPETVRQIQHDLIVIEAARVARKTALRETLGRDIRGSLY